MSAALALLALSAPLLVSIAVAAWAMGSGRRALARQILIAWDQGINVLVWARDEGWGHADETLSARAWRLRRRVRTWGRFRRALDGAFALLGDPDHCLDAYLAELERRQLPSAYRIARPQL